MALPVRVFHVGSHKELKGHTQAVRDLCRECGAKGALDMGLFVDSVPVCSQIAFFSMPEADIAIENVFNSFANRKADYKHLGEWLQNMLNEESRFKATAEGTWSGVTDILDKANAWRDMMWGWYTIIDVADVDWVLEADGFFKGFGLTNVRMPIWGYVLEESASSSSGSAPLVEHPASAEFRAKRLKISKGHGGSQVFVHRLRMAAGVPVSSQEEEVTHIEKTQEQEEGEEFEEPEKGQKTDDPLIAEVKDPVTHIAGDFAVKDEDIDMDELARSMADGAARALAYRQGARISKATQTAYPQWDRWDPTRWLWVLEEAGCDQLAQNTFMELAQLPHDEASYHANQIVSYLRCKDVRNPSKLVHSWALDGCKKVQAKLSRTPRS